MAALQGRKVNRVACGSAHTLAWSTSKPASAGKLPSQVGAAGGGVGRGSGAPGGDHWMAQAPWKWCRLMCEPGIPVSQQSFRIA